MICDKCGRPNSPGYMGDLALCLCGISERSTIKVRLGTPAMLDVLVATLDESRKPAGLEHVPSAYYYHSDTSKPWAQAANNLLDKARFDVLFLDDDVTLTAQTFDLLDRYYQSADVFGFTLITPAGWDGWQVASAGFGILPDHTLVRPDFRQVMTPRYCAHVTASCLYIKKHVLDAGVRFPVWPGLHYEDVAFTLDCWLHGFKVAYLPGLVEHPITSVGAGVTKSNMVNFNSRRAQNERILQDWMREKDVSGAIKMGVVPSTCEAL